MKKMKRILGVGAMAALLAAGSVHRPVFALSEVQEKPPALELTEEKEKAVAVFVGDQAVFHLKNRSDYDALLKKIQRYFTAEGAAVVNMTLEPALRVETVASAEKTVSVEEAYKILMTGGRREAVYVAEETESLESVAKKCDMTVDEIKALNAHWEDPLHKGSKITILQAAPMVTVTLDQVAKTQSQVPFRTVTKEDPAQLKSVKKVEQAGRAGILETTTRMQSKDGRIFSSVTESSRLVQEPMDEILVVGTKESAATGGFIKPVEGRLSSPFGPRWGRFHYGIDLANCIGTDIKASDGGVVTRAGMAGSYGNLIIIDHQNGTSTRYAHLSVIGVKVGDVVAQGQSIGKLGSTGRSTGPHLHFEVRVGDTARNPLEFIKL
ncbi:MAG: peptidoglycan DD-metalloendopeptidase family protein [Peptoniphilus sp.]|nr:peptidoglycan DD-metalloendopeptidase family protein [Peptoniphilus sp.]MDY3118264.1 peptidoglycan DD-metalloendopeptidase family protein [Peptoniphilus sp.]